MIYHQNTTTLRKLAENIYFSNTPEKRDEFLENLKQLSFNDSIEVSKQIGEIAFYNWYLYPSPEFFSKFKELVFQLSLLDLSFLPASKAEQQVYGVFWQYISGEKDFNHPEFLNMENRKYFLLYRLKQELPIVYDALDDIFFFEGTNPEKKMEWKLAQNQYEKYLIDKEFSEP